MFRIVKEKIKDFIVKHFLKIPKWFFIAVSILAFIGFINAFYLTVEHYRDQDVLCPISMSDCATVTNSEYSEILGIPLSLLGVFYYSFVFSGLLFIYFKKKGNLFIFLSAITAFGFLFSCYLVYLQLFIIGSVCPYCMLSAFISTMIFVLDIIVLYKNRKVVPLIIKSE